jgi:hypothetical protein
MLDSAAGHLQAMLKIKTLAISRSAISCLQYKIAILRRNVGEDKFQARFCAEIALEDPKRLVGPEYFTARDPPAKAAGMTEPLSFGQVRFAAVQSMCEKLVLGNIYRAADMPFSALAIDKQSTDAANVPKLTIGTNNALCGIKGRTFRQYSVDQVGHGLAILWVNAIQVLLDARRFAGRIESVYAKQFWRPIVESVGIEGPTSHVSKALPFGKVEFASLQLLGVAADQFFRRFAVFYVDTRAVPLNNLPAFVAYGDLMVQHPAIFTVGTKDACFIEEGFSTGQ